MKIAVVGTGYVGLSDAVLLAQRHEVKALDIDAERVDMVNRARVADRGPRARGLPRRTASSTSPRRSTRGRRTPARSYVVIATPTDYDAQTNFFNTGSVESVIADAIAAAPDATMVIKSTVPVGFTERMRAAHPDAPIIFSPEFLREGRALHDNLHPSRIVVGRHRADAARSSPTCWSRARSTRTSRCCSPGSTEAEAIKLFANTYLALRVAYFNELDTYAAIHGLDPAQIIEGVGLDPRIGTHYNNPSFGYGGYCLPKDTKQLQANYRDVPQNLISAIVEANTTRKDFIAEDILRRKPRHGRHLPADHEGGLGQLPDVLDPGRDEAAQGQGRRGRSSTSRRSPRAEFFNSEVVGDLDEFKQRADVIVANRRADALADVADKVYTRDIYGRD